MHINLKKIIDYIYFDPSETFNWGHHFLVYEKPRREEMDSRTIAYGYIVIFFTFTNIPFMCNLIKMIAALRLKCLKKIIYLLFSSVLFGLQRCNTRLKYSQALYRLFNLSNPVCWTLKSKEHGLLRVVTAVFEWSSRGNTGIFPYTSIILYSIEFEESLYYTHRADTMFLRTLSPSF